MNRKQRRASGRIGTAPDAGATRPAPRPEIADLFAAALALHRAGNLVEAERRYRQIVSLAPAHADARSRLGAALLAQGKTGEAISQIEHALALRPDLFEAQANLAQACLAMGQSERAIAAARRALELRETPQSQALFAQCVKLARFTADDGRYRPLLLRALTEGWARPRELTAACVSLIKLGPAVKSGIALANKAWPQRVSGADLFGVSALRALANDQLLLRLLESDPVTDIGLERLLTNVRRALVTEAFAAPAVAGQDPLEPRLPSAADMIAGDAELLTLCYALARQCFINEYVFSIAEEEEALAGRMRAALDKALAAGEEFPVLWLALAGAYFPLHALANAQALPARNWPACVRALLVQQIVEPAQERRIAAALPALTAIDDDVSRIVRLQYEQNPYPRWVQAGMEKSPGSAQPQPPGAILIAGCGTGLSAIELARHAAGSRILAVDLSRASLAYAKRVADEIGLQNIEFAQADIMRLAAIGRQFDFIDASGVLHHLADPWEGWRVLASLLQPGGAMQIGLYSERARQNVVAARTLIAQRGYRPIAEDIRRCREQIAAADDPLLQSLTRSEDFYSMSECRDLLFHPQEHRLTLPQIKAFLAANALRFAGFAVAAGVLQRFAARFPQRAAMTDLERWHEFEAEAPDTFAGMYQFSVRKPARA